MDPALVYGLLGSLLWAAMLYYVFIVRRAQDLGAGGRSAIVIITFLIVPVIAFTLWNQNESKVRLEELGFKPYPGLGNSIGVSVGISDLPTWLFSLKEPQTSVLDFYQKPENREGWDLISANSDSLVFRSGESKVRLQVSNGKAAFILFRPGEARPKPRMSRP